MYKWLRCIFHHTHNPYPNLRRIQAKKKTLAGNYFHLAPRWITVRKFTNNPWATWFSMLHQFPWLTTTVKFHCARHCAKLHLKYTKKKVAKQPAKFLRELQNVHFAELVSLFSTLPSILTPSPSFQLLGRWESQNGWTLIAWQLCPTLLQINCFHPPNLPFFPCNSTVKHHLAKFTLSPMGELFVLKTHFQWKIQHWLPCDCQAAGGGDVVYSLI